MRKTTGRLFAAVVLIAASAHRLPAQDCPAGAPQTTVFYINGVDVDRTKAEDALVDALKPKVRQRLPGTPLELECPLFDLAYNTNEAFFLDLVEAAHQIAQGETLRLWRVLAGLEAAPDWLQQAAAEAASRLARQLLDGDPDLQSHVAAYLLALQPQAAKVILVPHSQGNLYANAAYNILVDGLYQVEASRIRIVSVASPATFVAGNGPYTTLVEDVFANYFFAQANPLRLPPNIQNPPSLCLFASLCHSFAKSYLSGADSKARIVSHILGASGPIAPLPLPRAWLGGTSVGSAIYAIGGGTCSGVGCAGFGGLEAENTDAYDPVLNAWATKAPLPTKRFGLAAAAANGKIYVFGGTNGCCSQPVTEVEAYDLGSASWSSRGFMPTPRWKPVAALVGSVIYVIGGGTTGNQNIPTGIVERFDAASESWMSGAPMPMPTARWGSSAAVINGLVYVAGGFEFSSFGPSHALETYDPVNDRWSMRRPMPTARWDLAAAAVNGKLYAIGGWDHVGQTVLGTVEEYDPSTNSWASKAPMLTPRTGLIAIPVNGKIYAIGGSTNTAVVGTVEVYSPAANAWSALVP